MQADDVPVSASGGGRCRRGDRSGSREEVAEHVHRLHVAEGDEGGVHGVVVVVERLAVKGAVEQKVGAPRFGPGSKLLRAMCFLQNELSRWRLQRDGRRAGSPGSRRVNASRSVRAPGARQGSCWSGDWCRGCHLRGRDRG